MKYFVDQSKNFVESTGALMASVGADSEYERWSTWLLLAAPPPPSQDVLAADVDTFRLVTPGGGVPTRKDGFAGEDGTDEVSRMLTKRDTLSFSFALV